MSPPAAQDPLRDASTTTHAVAHAIKTLRRRAGLTQDQLAESADLDRSHISQLERGLRMPSLDTLLRLAAGLGIPFILLAQAIQNALDPHLRDEMRLAQPPDITHLPPKPGRPGRRARKSRVKA